MKTNLYRLKKSRRRLAAAAYDTTANTELKDIAAKIAAEHKAVIASFNSGFKHALSAGNLLIEAKSKLPHGGWLAWLKDHCDIVERTAQLYMRLAREVPKLPATKSATVADLSIRRVISEITATTRPETAADHVHADDVESDEAAHQHHLSVLPQHTDSLGRCLPQKPLAECMARGLDQLDNAIEALSELLGRPNTEGSVGLEAWVARLEESRTAISHIINLRGKVAVAS